MIRAIERASGFWHAGVRGCGTTTRMQSTAERGRLCCVDDAYLGWQATTRTKALPFAPSARRIRIPCLPVLPGWPAFAMQDTWTPDRACWLATFPSMNSEKGQLQMQEEKLKRRCAARAIQVRCIEQTTMPCNQGLALTHAPVPQASTR